jgi:Tfp pilus assembly protein PilV
VSGRGETLVEVVVALLLLAVGALALAGSIGQAQKARAKAASSGLALAAAEGWLEAWRAGPQRGRASGADFLEWGSWRAVLEWETSDSGCQESARVAVAPARGDSATRLSSRRILAGAWCGP